MSWSVQCAVYVQALMPHEKHQSDHVNTTTSGDSHVHVDNEDDMEDVINHAGTSMEIVWKGLVVLAGVYVFFITERVISLFRTARRRRNKVLLTYNSSSVSSSFFAERCNFIAKFGYCHNMSPVFCCRL